MNERISQLDSWLRKGRSGWAWYGLAVVFVALFTLGRIWLESTIAEGTRPYLPYLLVILCCAHYGGLGPGLVATVLGGFAADYFFVSPLREVSFWGVVNGFWLAAHLLVGAVVSWLIESLERGRRQLERETESRRLLHERVEASEKRLSLLVEHVSEYAIILLDPQGNITSWGRGASRLFGWKASEVTGESPACIFTPEDIERGVDQQDRDTARAAGQAGQDRWHVRKDGSRFWANDVVVALPDAEGNLVAFAKIVRDLTADIEAEKTLRESEERLRTMVESVKDYAIIRLDPEGCVNYWNDGAARLLGWDEHEILGKPSAVIFTAEDREEDAPQLELSKARRSGHAEDERWHVRKDGSRFYGSGMVMPLRDDSGKSLGFVKVFRDMTERKRYDDEVGRLNEDLKRRVAEFETLLEVIPIGIGITFSRDCRHIRVNPSFARSLGISTADNASHTAPESERPPYRLVDDEGNTIPPEMLPIQLAAREGREVIDYTYSVIHPDGRVVQLLAHVAPLFDDHGEPRGCVGAFIDVTERRKAANRNKFLVTLDDAVRRLTDPSEIIATTARHLGDFLGVDCCAYAEVEADGKTMRLTGNYTSSTKKLVDEGKFPSYGDEALRRLREDQPYVVHDVESPISPVDNLDAYHNAGIQALICVPLHKSGKFVATLAVHQNSPRHWSDEEVELVQLVANRSWESIERARVTRTLQESEAKFRQLANTIPQLAWMARPDGSIFWYNDRWFEYTGTTPESQEGWGWQSVHDPEALPTVMERWKRSIETGEPFDMTFPIKGADGQFRPFLTRVNPLRDSAGRIFLWIGTNTDISERSKLEERFRISADSAPVLIWISDVTADCIWFNRPWLEFTGRTMAQELGNGWTEVVHPDDFNRCLQVFRSNFDSRTSFRMEYRLRRHDGQWRWVIDNGTPLYEGPGGEFSGFIGSCLDITELKQAEEERQDLLEAERTARTEAERASQLKDEFLATLSHELRTPLNAILGWAQLLRMGTNHEAEVGEGLAVIERNARLQVQLIEDLLDMSRIISGNLRLNVQRVDIADVIREAVESARPAAEAKEIRLEQVLDSHVGFVRGDPARLQQVVWNLLTNGIKFTPNGGKLQVALERVNSHIEINVSDSGAGIPPDFLPYVFERFRQSDGSTTRQHGGLGLGLSIVKSIVEAHGGTVHAKSPGENQGSTFSVALPLASVHEDDGELAHPQLSMGDDSSEAVSHDRLLQGVSVLMVDDDKDARDLVSRVLKACQATVFAASTVADALELLKSKRPDVLLSDIGMPGQDGYDLIRQVRELPTEDGRDTPAAALTAFAHSGDRRRALLAGYQSHVAKPVEPSELVAVVASLAGVPARRVLKGQAAH